MTKWAYEKIDSLEAEAQHMLQESDRLRAEVERLRETEKKLREISHSLKDDNAIYFSRNLELEQERDQLKAAVALAVDAFKRYEMDVETYPTIEHISMMRNLESALAAHDAEVIARFLATEAPRIDAGGPNPIDPKLHHCEWALHQERERLHAAANQLRQQANPPEFKWRDLGDGKPIKVQVCQMCGVAPSNVDDCGEFGNPDCPYFGIGREEYERRFSDPK